MPTLENILEIQEKGFSKSPYPSLKQRKEHLKLILKILSDYKQEWIDAISTDFGHRSKYETLMMELMQTQHLIKFVLSKLRRWMRPSTRNSVRAAAKRLLFHRNISGIRSTAPLPGTHPANRPGRGSCPPSSPGSSGRCSASCCPGGKGELLAAVQGHY